MTLSSIQKHSSKSVKGASFVTRRIGPALRARINVEISDARAKLGESQRKLQKLEDQLRELLDNSPKGEDGSPTATTDPGQATDGMWTIADQIIHLRDDMVSIARSEMAPVWFRQALVSISGVEMDGNPITGQQLCEYGPDELFDEVFDVLSSQFNLTAAETKNSQSPTTSQPPADGTAMNETSGSASAANTPETTSGETAGDTSLSLQNAA